MRSSAVRILDGQAFAAFRTTTGQNLAAVFGSHAGTEAMDALALEVCRLEGSFHGRFPFVRRLWSVRLRRSPQKPWKKEAQFYGCERVKSNAVDRGVYSQCCSSPQDQ